MCKSSPNDPLQPMSDIYTFISKLPLLTDLHLYGDPTPKQIEQLLQSIVAMVSPLSHGISITTLHLEHLQNDFNGCYKTEVPTKWRRSICLRSSHHRHHHYTNTPFSDDIHEFLRDLSADFQSSPIT
jgi:hypothetical protein